MLLSQKNIYLQISLIFQTNFFLIFINFNF